MKRGGANAGHSNPHHRHKHIDMPDTAAAYWCGECYRWSYRTKRAAKRAARALHPRAHTWPLYCPSSKGWHFTSVKPNTTEEEPS